MVHDKVIFPTLVKSHSAIIISEARLTRRKNLTRVCRTPQRRVPIIFGRAEEEDASGGSHRATRKTRQR